MKTLFPEATNVNDARLQIAICERARTLFTTGGYSWYIADCDPYLFGVCGPDGQHYAVDICDNTCRCAGFAKHKECKDRIAIAHSPDCYEASQVKRLELFYRFDDDQSLPSDLIPAYEPAIAG